MTIIHRSRAARHPASALDGVSGAATEHGRGDDSKIAEEAAALHVASAGLRKLVRRRHVDRSQLGRAGNARPDRNDVVGAAQTTVCWASCYAATASEHRVQLRAEVPKWLWLGSKLVFLKYTH